MKFLNKEYFSERDAAQIINQILDAIAYCHQNNIMHRDLKPENILLDWNDNKTIKIINFGTSTESKSDEEFKNQFGSIYYASPEVLNGEYDEKSDVWSIGVMLFIMLGGRPPFEGNSEKEIYKKIKKGKYYMDLNSWKDVSDEAIDLVRRLLKFDPNKRITCANALEHRWIKDWLENDSNTHITLSGMESLRDFRAEK